MWEEKTGLPVILIESSAEYIPTDGWRHLDYTSSEHNQRCLYVPLLQVAFEKGWVGGSGHWKQTKIVFMILIGRGK